MFPNNNYKHMFMTRPLPSLKEAANITILSNSSLSREHFSFFLGVIFTHDAVGTPSPAKAMNWAAAPSTSSLGYAQSKTNPGIMSSELGVKT